jgi:hypothetical protein
MNNFIPFIFEAIIVCVIIVLLTILCKILSYGNPVFSPLSHSMIMIISIIIVIVYYYD